MWMAILYIGKSDTPFDYQSFKLQLMKLNLLSASWNKVINIITLVLDVLTTIVEKIKDAKKK